MTPPAWLDPRAPRGPDWAALSVLTSDDLDETRERIAHIYKPHQLAVIGPQQRVRARMHHCALGPAISLNRLAHGAAVHIDPDRLEHFFLVQMPLSGEASVWHQNSRHRCTPGQASVISPQDGVRMDWSADCDQFMLHINRQRLEHVASALWGQTPAALRLATTLDLRQGAGAHWWQLMHYLAAWCQPGTDRSSHGLHTALLEDHVLSLLLQMVWAPAQADRAVPTHASPRLRQLEQYIEAHLDQAITVTDLAHAAHVSVRLVQQLFAREHGTTPLAYIRRLRLARVRHDLSHPGPDTRVLQTATRWGFEHAGRFAAAYQQAYGESPSTTLARHMG